MIGESFGITNQDELSSRQINNLIIEARKKLREKIEKPTGVRAFLFTVAFPPFKNALAFLPKFEHPDTNKLKLKISKDLIIVFI